MSSLLCYSTSTQSSLSSIAVKIVTSLLNKVDPESGQSMRDQLLSNPDVQGKVKDMCDQIVQEVVLMLFTNLH